MHGSEAHAALGLIVVALALAALAAQRGGEDDAPTPREQAPPPSAANTAAVRALRDGQRLQLNSASAEELTLVPGIGPQLAQRIVAERARRGGFSAWHELREVRGLGPKTLQRIAPFFEPFTGRTGTRTSRPR